jgi:hypothetical protein
MGETFSPITWVNDGSPALNATNLNRLETGIEAIDDRAAALELGVDTPVIVTYAASLTINALQGALFRITATGNLTITDITNGTNGQEITIEVLASGANRTLTIAAGSPTTITAGQWWTGAFRYNAGLDQWLFGGSSAGGSGAVSSVNGQTGTVVLTADNIADGTTGKILTATERTQIGAVPSKIDVTLINAKGDLLAGTANDTVAVQSVGTSGQVLAANPGTTSGLSWITLPAAGSGLNPGCVDFDSFSGADDEAKLTNALSYMAAQTYKPTLLFGNRLHTFTTPRTVFSGLRMAGGAVGHTEQVRGGTPIPNQINLSTGTGWLVLPSGNTFGMSFQTMAFNGNSGSRFFQPSGTGVIWTSNFHNLSFNAMQSVFGNSSQQALFTASSFSGWWNVNNSREAAFWLGGSDNSFWAGDEVLLDSDISVMNLGTPMRFHFNYSGMSKTTVGPMYITAEQVGAINITGGGEGQTLFTGCRIEGRNASTPSYGALVRQTGNSGSTFRDCWWGYAMSNPSAAGRGDAGVIHVTAGTLVIDGAWYGRASATAESVPFIYATGTAKVFVRNVQVGTGSGAATWTGKPIVARVGTSSATVDADSTVTVTTV